MLYQYGSAFTGLSNGNSDIDLTILTNSYVNEKNFLQYVFLYFK